MLQHTLKLSLLTMLTAGSASAQSGVGINDLIIGAHGSESSAARLGLRLGDNTQDPFQTAIFVRGSQPIIVNNFDTDGDGHVSMAARTKADILLESIPSAAAGANPMDLKRGMVLLKSNPGHEGGGLWNGHSPLVFPQVFSQGLDVLMVINFAHPELDADVFGLVELDSNGFAHASDGFIPGVPGVRLFDVTGMPTDPAEDRLAFDVTPDDFGELKPVSGQIWIDDRIGGTLRQIDWDPADFNFDGVRNISDLFDYINVYTDNTATAGGVRVAAGDVNGDGVVNISDLFEFVRLFTATPE
ncbi:MAG: hypothetical protein AAGI17_06585 [Planctomycetota bacterium]